MSVEEIKTLVRRWYGAWSKGKAAAMAVVDELFAADVVNHSAYGEEIRGIENQKQYMIRTMYDAFSDIHMAIDDIVVEGDKVAVRATFTGTNTGEFMGHPPTNKKITIRGIDIVRIVDGKVAERWNVLDRLGMMEQLGLIPTPKKEK